MVYLTGNEASWAIDHLSMSFPGSEDVIYLCLQPWWITSSSMYIILHILLSLSHYFITRDDEVSQRLKFGSTFLLSSSWSKIALFF